MQLRIKRNGDLDLEKMMIVMLFCDDNQPTVKQYKS